MANIVAKTFDFDPEPPAFEDPFQKSWDEVKEMRGLDTNFKRRTTRMVKGYEEEAKARPTGRDDAGRKSLATRQGKGYATFDVIQPPYDLIELANFYDSNFANHAAIDAKVENIVGMGYDWKLTH